MRLNLDVFRENAWSGDVNGNQRGTPLSSSDPVTILPREKTTTPWEDFTVKCQGRARLKLKWEGEGNNHNREWGYGKFLEGKRERSSESRDRWEMGSGRMMLRVMWVLDKRCQKWPWGTDLTECEAALMRSVHVAPNQPAWFQRDDLTPNGHLIC